MTHPSPTENTEYWFVFQNELLLILPYDPSHPLLTSALITDMKKALTRQYFLGQFENFQIYCAELQLEFPLPEHFNAIKLRQALELLGPDWYNFAAKAYAIINWDKNHQFCGRCASVTIHKSGTFERMCPVCLLTFYPRISPSIIVLIQKENTILMARSPHFIPGVYGLIAGFVEAGENIEDAVHREVKEEIGIKIKNLRYFGSQSWPFPDSLMIAFIAEYDSGELIINHAEIEDANWYSIDNLPGWPSSSISIARKLINYVLAEQKQKSLK